MKYFNLKLFLLFLVPTLPVQAQTVPPVIPPEELPPSTIPELQPVTPSEQEFKEISPLPPLDENLLNPEPTPEVPADTLPIQDRIIIRKFNVVGNTVFSQEEIDRVLKPYTLRLITFNELLEAQTALTRLYVENGYISSGAFIPPQDIEDRVVTVRVIEGVVEDITVTGLERLDSDYVRSRLKIATGAPLNQDKLLQALQLLRLDPLIDNVSAELSAGIHPASSILEVTVKEADAFSTRLSYDNFRVPSVGTDRRQAQITHNNLLGFGDRFNVEYTNTDGSDALSDLSYRIPLNPRNGTLKIAYSYSDSEIIEEPFDDLDIKSELNSYKITYRQPIHQTPTEDIALGFSFTRDDSETSLLGNGFPLSRGASDEGMLNISALRFFQEYTNRNERQVFALSSQFSIGINAFDATINDTIENKDLPDSKFFAWRGQAQYLRLLDSNTSFLFRSDLQFSDRPLVALEQFSLGGAFNVRGYRQDALLADNGLFASTELRRTLVKIPEWQTTLQIAPFADFGAVWNTDDVGFDRNTLVSVGAGLRLQVSDVLAARIDWGIPLVDIEDSDDTLQENGVYFSVELRPF